MKHIILSIGQTFQIPEDLFRGLDKGNQRERFFLLLYTGEAGTWIRAIGNLPVGCFTFGENTSWYDLFGNVRNVFLKEQFRFQLDVLVNASGVEKATVLLKDIQQQANILGLSCAIRILFLADSLSENWKEEEKFFHELKRSNAVASNSSDVFPWNSLYLLMSENTEQESLRKTVLPFILDQDCDAFEERTVKTCSISIQSLNIEALNDIPQDLAKKTVCGLLVGKNKADGLSVLLLGRGRQIQEKSASSLVFMKEAFSQKVPFPHPSAYDLLIHKGSPEGDSNIQEMLKAFYRDNPECDPERYNRLGIAEMEKIPLIYKAADLWEQMVLAEVYRSGDLSDLLTELESESTFDQILAALQKPNLLSLDLNLTDKEGYTQAALEKLAPYADKLGGYLEEVIFYARIMLIRARIPSLRKKIRSISDKRNAAVNKALRNLSTEEVTRMTGSWGYQLQNSLSQRLDQIMMPARGEDLDIWIEDNTRKLLSMIPQPDFSAAQKELAKSVNGKIQEMESELPRKLLSLTLDSTVKQTLPFSWYIYEKANVSIPGCHFINEPMILCLHEWYLDLNASLPNQQVFLPNLISVESENNKFSIEDKHLPEQTIQEVEDQPDEALLPREDYEEFNGSLRWIWKDTSWKNARVDVFESVKGELKKEPLFSTSVSYRSDDIYSICDTGRLPSGALLCFRVTYLDKGRAVDNTEEVLWRRSPRTVLKVESISVREGGLFSKKPYIRMKIRSEGFFSPEHIAIAGSTGYVYRAAWEETRDGWISERLPAGENWYVVDLPGDPFEYVMI